MWIKFCCIFLAASTVSLAQEAPELEILPEGSEILRDQGDAGFFTCRAVGQKDLITDVVWIDPRGQEVPDERLRRVNSASTAGGKGRGLYITDINEQDAGDYTCRARYGDQAITKKFTLRVYMSIRWVDAPKVQNPLSGTRATIKCVVKADPPAFVEWLHSSGELIRKTDRYTPLEEGLLHIENITSADDGVLVCRAKVPTNGALDERDIKVEVYSRPQITEPATSNTQVNITESETGSIRCMATGKPAPRLTWLGPGGTDAALVPGLTVDEGTLTFRPARREMAGQYRCSAANEVFTVQTNVNVVVIVPPEIVRYDNITSAESEPAQLTCRVSGSPPITVTFRRVGSEQDISGDGRATVLRYPEGELQVGELSISNITRADAGLYECIAVNGGGDQARSAGRLTVQYRPRLSSPQKEVFTWSSAEQPAELSCSAPAEPPAEFSWTFAGRPVDGARTEEMRQGDTSMLRVTPTEASHYGIYQCTAFNSQGSDSLDISLKEATEPSSVSGVTAQEHTATSVKFSIPPPASDGGLPVTHYVAQYKLSDQPWDNSRDVDWPAQGIFKVEGLMPEKTYDFRFAAENAVGVSDWSEPLQETMPMVGVPQPPLLVSAAGGPVAEETSPDVVIDSDQPHSYEARWTAGADNGAQIDHYEVSFYKVISNKNVWHKVSTKRTSVVQAPGPLTFRLTDLKAESHYKLELKAHNKMGYSESAQVIIRTATDTSTPEPPAPARASSLVVGVVIAALLALVVLCDLTCYAVNNRGITHFLCSRARGTSRSEKLTEEAASEKEPLQENGNRNKDTPPPPPPEANGERDGADEELNIDKAQLDAAKDSAV